MCWTLECLNIVLVLNTMESPWSTPTQSEIGEAEQALNAKVANDFIMDSDPLAQREMGDGEPSFDANVDDFMANNRLGRTIQGRMFSMAKCNWTLADCEKPSFGHCLGHESFLKFQCVIQLIQDMSTQETKFGMTRSQIEQKFLSNPIKRSFLKLYLVI